MLSAPKGFGNSRSGAATAAKTPALPTRTRKKTTTRKTQIFFCRLMDLLFNSPREQFFAQLSPEVGSQGQHFVDGKDNEPGRKNNHQANHRRGDNFLAFRDVLLRTPCR